MRLVLLGAPGSGKGTQASLVKTRFDCVHISTGDILRKNLSEKTELGLRAESFMNKGELVPDALIVDMVGDRLRKDDVSKGFLMDGFPRTIPQAEAFDKILTEAGCPLDAVVLMDIDEELIVQRLTNRRTCRSCGKILSLLTEPNVNSCSDCGGELYQRDDDSERVIRNRLQVYREQTEPLVAFYKGKGLLRQVDASGSPQDIFKSIEAVLV